MNTLESGVKPELIMVRNFSYVTSGIGPNCWQVPSFGEDASFLKVSPI